MHKDWERRLGAENVSQTTAMDIERVSVCCFYCSLSQTRQSYNSTGKRRVWRTVDMGLELAFLSPSPSRWYQEP